MSIQKLWGYGYRYGIHRLCVYGYPWYPMGGYMAPCHALFFIGVIYGITYVS